MKLCEVIIDRVKLVKLSLKRGKPKKPPEPQNIVVAANKDETGGYDTAIAAQ